MYDFELDENENNINRARHKIDFMDAIQVFFDERRIGQGKYIPISKALFLRLHSNHQ